MDPDLDPNLQHWQDRSDNFQWVVGSLGGAARQHPDLSSPPPSADCQRVLVLTLLAIDGVLCAIVASFFLPAYIGIVAVSRSAR